MKELTAEEISKIYTIYTIIDIHDVRGFSHFREPLDIWEESYPKFLKLNKELKPEAKLSVAKSPQRTKR